jgi:[ribosomal protein S18]-alanine N-acetyltransferase
VQFTFKLMDEVEARAIRAWRYEEPYAVYNAPEDSEDFSEELDRRSPYYAVRDERGELVGSFNFGTSALVWDSGDPGIYSENKTVAIGLGMRPDLTGKGLGLAFVEAGLAFAREQFHPDYFHLFVYTFNERAIKVYEQAGFQRVRVFMRRNIHGESEFLEMKRHA